MIEAIFICTTIILGYSTYNLMKKVEVLQDDLLNMDDVLQFERKNIKDAIESMREIDSKGGFESNDEVGAIFDSLKEVVYELEQNND
tara:strand:- start:1297 stop:1557 length:261 start_codon:yes stop_codon:yes gene_type:complete